MPQCAQRWGSAEVCSRRAKPGEVESASVEGKMLAILGQRGRHTTRSARDGFYANYD